MSIYTVNGSPIKYGNKWLATNGGTPSGELPPYDSSDAGKALVVNNEGDNVEWQTVGSSITVDQHYDSSSSNPQSGTAVAEALQTVPDELPSLTGNAGKVLKVNSGATGVEWATESAGATGTQEEFDWSTVTFSDIQSCLAANKVPVILYDRFSDNCVIRGYLREIDASGTYVGYHFVTPVDLGQLTTRMQSASVTKFDLYEDGRKYVDYAANTTAVFNVDSTMTLTQPNIYASELLLSVSNPLPASTSSDENKVLTVNSSGNAVWAPAQGGGGGTSYMAGDGIAIDGNHEISADVDGTTIGIDSTTKKIKLLSAIPTVDQTYNASSTNAQSGTAVASAVSNAVAGLDEVPAVTSSDNGKVLKATYSGGAGSYAWDTDNDTTYSAGNMVSINGNNAISVSTTAGITDIQMVNALPANPVATVLYLIPAT